jgi:hypothetical protein
MPIFVIQALLALHHMVPSHTPGFSAETTSVHVPRPFVTHDLHGPAHGALQQNPSVGDNVMHSFERQSPSALQADPVVVTQLPRPAQIAAGERQVAPSPRLLMMPWQVPEAHVSHSPLQSSGQQRLSTQRAFAQSLLSVQLSPVAFLQKPSGPQVSPTAGQSQVSLWAGTARQPLVSSVSAGRFSQRPLALHLRHVPVQSDSQQTPSVHWPLAHSGSLTQGVPSGAGSAHRPALHTNPLGQPGVVLQVAPRIGTHVWAAPHH